MSKIQFFAFETSGLKAGEAKIIEVGIATLDTKTGDVEASSYLLDPGKHDMSEDLIEFHRKSGLIDELIAAGSAGKFENWHDIEVPAAHMRITWAKAFITPFCGQPDTQILLGGAVHGSVDFDTIKLLGVAAFDLEIPKPERSRVEDKLLVMLATVRAMRAGTARASK